MENMYYQCVHAMQNWFPHKTSYFLQADEKNSRGKKELANKFMLTICGFALFFETCTDDS